jgi:type I restriction enzyme S subunit
MKAVEGWTTEQLGSVIKDIGDGGTPNTNKREYFGGSIPWVVIQDIRKSISTTKTTLTRLGLASCSAKLWPAGSVILSTGATIGEVGLAEVPVATKQGIHGIVCKEEELSSQYLYYKLQTLREFLNANAQGSTIREIRANFLRTISISFPTSKPEQIKIAEILSTVDRAIEQTEAMIAKQQRIKTGLMQDLLTRGIDEHGNLRSEQTHKFKDSLLGRISVEWEVATCISLCREIVVGIVIRPAQYYRPEGVPVLRSANVRENEISDENLVYMSERDNEHLLKSQLHTGDLVTVRTGYPGTTSVVSPKYNGSNCVDIVISRPNHEKVRSGFLSIWVNSDHGKRQVLEGQGGLAQQHFNVGEMRSLLVKVPCLQEQERIEKTLKSQNEAMDGALGMLYKFRSLKTALMQDLLTGKKRVTALLKDREVATL